MWILRNHQSKLDHVSSNDEELAPFMFCLVTQQHIKPLALAWSYLTESVGRRLLTVQISYQLYIWRTQRAKQKSVKNLEQPTYWEGSLGDQSHPCRTPKQLVSMETWEHCWCGCKTGIISEPWARSKHTFEIVYHHLLHLSPSLSWRVCCVHVCRERLVNSSHTSQHLHQINVLIYLKHLSTGQFTHQASKFCREF